MPKQQTPLLASATDFGVKFDSAYLNQICSYWNSLPIDPYVMVSPASRRRRHGRFRYHKELQDLEQLPNEPYLQSIANNSVYGNIARVFAPLDKQFVREPGFLLTLLKHASQELSFSYSDVLVNCHQVRIPTAPGFAGHPSPEGRHMDGFDFVSIHLMARINCSGGETFVWTDQDEAVLTHTLEKPLDSLYLNDKVFSHFTSPIFSESGIGYRDVLLLSYEPYTPR